MKSKARIRCWFGFHQVELSAEMMLNLEELETDRTEGPAGYFRHKTAESYRGFLVYVARTYRALLLLVPYLLGRASINHWKVGAKIERRTDGESRTPSRKKLEIPVKRKIPVSTKMYTRFNDGRRGSDVSDGGRKPSNQTSLASWQECGHYAVRDKKAEAMLSHGQIRVHAPWRRR
jgi:hypothetical protein